MAIEPPLLSVMSTAGVLVSRFLASKARFNQAAVRDPSRTVPRAVSRRSRLCVLYISIRSWRRGFWVTPCPATALPHWRKRLRRLLDPLGAPSC